jgi:lysophospholipid hydrolase
VGTIDSDRLYTYGDEINGWWVFFNRWNPFAKKVEVATLTEV